MVVRTFCGIVEGSICRCRFSIGVLGEQFNFGMHNKFASADTIVNFPSELVRRDFCVANSLRSYLRRHFSFSKTAKKWILVI